MDSDSEVVDVRASGPDAASTSDGTTSTIHWHPDPSTKRKARQEFNNIHNADSSKNHFGNAYYYNTYTYADQSVPHDTRPQKLMAALAFDNMRDRLFTVSPACANTCGWFLRSKEYKRWRDPISRASHNGILWIKGKAGTGKSTLMRYIHDHAPDCYGCWKTLAFFFNGRSPKPLARSTKGMYRSLLHQLFETFPRLKVAAAQRNPIGQSHVWTLEMLEDMFRKAIFGLATDERIICYVDALDECAIDRVRLAIEFFEDLSQSTTQALTPFLICFSSRYYPHITMHTHLDVKLDTKSEHLRDIAAYLDNRLTLPLPAKVELKTEIEKRCSGIFLWVVLVVRMLKESLDMGATRHEVHNLLKRLPQELNALFARIARSADAGFVVAMRWVCFAEWSLNPQELYFAIRTGLRELDSAFWDKSQVDRNSIRSYILHVSRGLIECVKLDDSQALLFPSRRGSRAQFVHESVKEYPLSGNLADLDSVPRLDLISASHTKMTRDCQYYLALCVHGQSNMASLGERIRIFDTWSGYPLSWYANRKVFGHLQTAYLYGSADINLTGFPLKHYTIVRQHLDYPEDQAPPYFPDHSATLLAVLIELRCFKLAEIHLQTHTCIKDDPGCYVKQCRACKPALPAPQPDLSTCCGSPFGSPLHAAVHESNVHLVRTLLEKGANADAYLETSPGVFEVCYPSPLESAVGKRDPEMTRLLLDHGARVDCHSPYSGFTPLHQACSDHADQFTIIKQLLDGGANVNVRSRAALDKKASKRRWTAMHLLVVASRRETKFRELLALLDAGADINATNDEDQTPLIVATSYGRLGFAEWLLYYGANAEYRSRITGTANATASVLFLESLQSAIRLRALEGLDTFLPLASRPILPQNRKVSRIARPLEAQSQRSEIRLRYRQPPRNRRMSPEEFEGLCMSEDSVTAEVGDYDYNVRDAPDLGQWSNEVERTKYVEEWLQESITGQS